MHTNAAGELARSGWKRMTLATLARASAERVQNFAPWGEFKAIFLKRKPLLCV